MGLWVFCHHSHHDLAFDIIVALVFVTSASLLLPMSLGTLTASPKGDPEVVDQAWGEMGLFCSVTTELRGE